MNKSEESCNEVNKTDNHDEIINKLKLVFEINSNDQDEKKEYIGISDAAVRNHQQLEYIKERPKNNLKDDTHFKLPLKSTKEQYDNFFNSCW